MDETKARLMKFPKEILVDYLLRIRFFEIHWRELEIKALLLSNRKLLAKMEVNNKRPTASLADWKSREAEWDRLQAQMDRNNAALHQLLRTRGGPEPSPLAPLPGGEGDRKDG